MRPTFMNAKALKQIEVGNNKKELKEHGSLSFPFLVSYERLSDYVSGSFFTHWHPELEITLATSGRMLYRVGRDEFRIKEGEVLVSNSGIFHSGTRDGEADCSYTSITFHPKLFYGSKDSDIYRKYAEPLLTNFSFPAAFFKEGDPELPEVRERIEALVELDLKRPDFYELDVRDELARLWRLLYRRSRGIRESVPRSRLEYERVKMMLDYMEGHYADKVRLSDIAGAAALCESECCRLFKRYMNMTIMEYLGSYRIDRSVSDLADPAFSVTEIAARAGFSDPNYYSKMFRSKKGLSPQKYRKRFMS